jgi:hypothetical protein
MSTTNHLNIHHMNHAPMIPRLISSELAAAMADTPVVLIHGARQVGKSTLMRWAVDRGLCRQSVTLDNLSVLSAASGDPQGFIAGLQAPVAIDQIQRVPELLLAIKEAVDRNRRPGMYLLTGSSNVMQVPRLADSLAGRMQVLMLRPFAEAELAGVTYSFIDRAFAKSFDGGKGHASCADTVERILRGGYPEAVSRTDPRRRDAWFRSYLDTVLQRDIQELAAIEGLADLPRLLAMLAGRACGLLNTQDLSRGIGIPATSLKRYLALIERVFLVGFLPAWSRNIGTRMVKSPKVLFSDPGLLAHLLGATRESLPLNPQTLGPLAETLVATELLKQSAWSSAQAAMHHFRTHAGREVDLVLESRDGGVVGVETKAASTVTRGDFAGLIALREAAGASFVRGIVIHNGPETVPFAPDLFAAPFAALWSGD